MVNRSTYYKHFATSPAPRTLENQIIKSNILQIYSRSKKRFGAAKIKIVLFRDYDINISVGRVYRLMKSMKLPKMSTVKPKFIRSKANSEMTIFQNHLQQKFNPSAPNQSWVSDITYIKAGGKFVYLCVIMDLFSRKILAFRVHHNMNSSFVIQTLQEALNSRNIKTNLLFHSDRGSQFTSEQFRNFCDQKSIIQSFSKKGYPFDNSVVESFFKYLKHEEIGRRSFKSISQVNLAVFEYIHGFYNSKRPHSANSMLTPDEKENIFYST